MALHPATSDPVHESVTLRPGPAQWLRGLKAATLPPAGSPAHTLRRELELPVHRPILMSGHQVEFWHAGVLAKLIAIEAAAVVMPDLALAWVDVDQDANQPWLVHYPARDASGGLRRATWDMSGGTLGERDASLAMLPPMPLTTPPADGYLPGVTQGLTRMSQAMNAARDQPSAAAHFGAAAFALAGQGVPAGTPTVRRVSAMSLSKTTMFQSLLQRMRREPERCWRAYNTAAADHPGAGVRPLEPNELPLWSIGPKGERRRVMAGEELAPGTLAPKALLMTLLLRLGACDLFVHGLGGERYDLVMEDWARGWLGDEAVLAPAAAASATRLLRFPGVTAPTPEEIRASLWRAAHARHEPAMLGDDLAASEKAALLAEMQTLPRRSGARREVFQKLQQVLTRVRASRAPELEALREQAAALKQARGLARVVHDRAWAFPMLEDASLQALREEIAGAFRGGK